MTDIKPVAGQIHPNLLVSIWLGRFPEAERPPVAVALDAWLAFRDARHQVLSRTLALAFRTSLGPDVAGADAYQRVDDFHEWLLATGVNSGNPFRPGGAKR